MYICILIFHSAVLSFAQSVYGIIENVGTLQIEVIVSEPFNVDISVNIVK